MHKGTDGSSGILKANPKFFDDYKKCISFDRRAYGSVITKQYGTSCCSDQFAIDLCKELSDNVGTPFKEDPTGVYTDSAVFMEIIPECTNISVGYFNEHSHTESQNISYVEWLCDGVVKVDWENLSVKRNPIPRYSSPKSKSNKTIKSTKENSTKNAEYRKIFDIVEEVMADLFNMECLNGFQFIPEKEMFFEDWVNDDNTCSVFIHDDFSITIGSTNYMDLIEMGEELNTFYQYDLDNNGCYYEYLYGDDDDMDEEEEEEEEEEEDNYYNHVRKEQKELSDALDKSDDFGEGNWSVVSNKTDYEDDEDDEDGEPFEYAISVTNFMNDVKKELLGKTKSGYISAYQMNKILTTYGKSVGSLIVWLYKKNNNPLKTQGLTWNNEKDVFHFEEI